MVVTFFDFLQNQEVSPPKLGPFGGLTSKSQVHNGFVISSFLSDFLVIIIRVPSVSTSTISPFFRLNLSRRNAGRYTNVLFLLS